MVVGHLGYLHSWFGDWAKLHIAGVVVVDSGMLRIVSEHRKLRTRAAARTIGLGFVSGGTSAVLEADRAAAAGYSFLEMHHQVGMKLEGQHQSIRHPSHHVRNIRNCC